MLARSCSKSFKLGFSSMWSENFQIQTGFRKGRGTRDQIANIHWIIEKAKEFQKIYASLTMLKPLIVWINHNKLWKILQEMGIPDHFTCLLRNLYSGQEVELDMEQQTDSKLRKEYIKAVYCHPAYVTYLQSSSCKMPNWMTDYPESRLPGEISTP